MTQGTLPPNLNSNAEFVEALPLLKKGALVAQDLTGFEVIEELDKVDRELLRDEKQHR